MAINLGNINGGNIREEIYGRKYTGEIYGRAEIYGEKYIGGKYT